MSTPEIAVLRQKIHGLSAKDYASALRTRLPDTEIAVANTPAEETELLRSVPIATGFSMSTAEIKAAENLDLFGCVYAGVGHLDLDAFGENGTAVTNASGSTGPTSPSTFWGQCSRMSAGSNRPGDSRTETMAILPGP